VDHEAVLTFEYATPGNARQIERALLPEIGDIDDDRSRTSMSRNDATVELRVEATDFVALRAGLNTWLSLVTVAETVGQAS
jgi:KEOPS complex subunit Pcc1